MTGKESKIKKYNNDKQLDDKRIIDQKKEKNEIFTTNHDLLELSKSERQNVYLEKIMTYEVDISFDQSHRFNGKDDVLMKGISKYLHCLNFNKTVIKKSSLHNIFEDLNSIIFILDSVKLDNIVIKCGYIFNIIAKLLFMTRHNLLGALYQTIDKGKDEFIMNTDVNLRDLGVDSNKTPDFLVFNEDNIQLIDFAVISDVEKLEDQKGGIDLNKYSNEADEISRMYDLPVIRKTIYFETSTGATNTKIDDYKDEFISFCNDVGKYWKYNLIDDENVNELKSDIVNKMVSSTNESIKNYNEVNQQYVSSSLPEGFLEKYKKSKDKLLNKAILNLDESGKYRMIFSRRGVFLEKDDNGFMISEWIVIIRKDDYFSIHKNLFCYFKGKFSKYKPGINDIVVNTTIDEMNEFSYSNGSGFSINSADTSVNVKTNHMPAYTTSNFYDNGKLSDMLEEDSIVDNKVDKEQVEEAVTLSKNKFVELHNLQKNRVKSPFIFNFPEVEKLITVENIKKHTIENIVIDIPQIGDRFIDDLLSKINNRKFSSGYKKIIPENLLDKSRDIESELNKILMRNCIDIKNRKKELKNLKESDQKVLELINSRKAVSNEIRKISEFVPTKIKCVKYSNYETQTLIRNSYNWDDDSTNRCYKDEQDNNPIDLLLDYLSEQHSSFLRKTPLKVDNSNDLDFFTKLNDSYIKEYENEYKDFRNMKIAYILDFISKLCYNLFYLSQTTNRGNEIMVENLGFSNVLLMVRGGKKLFKKRRSREFRLIMPCSDKLANFINMNDKFSSFQYINGFMITPWQSLHENELHKGLSCYESCLNYYLISSNRLKKDYASNLKTTMFPIMLFLHGRRITEGTLHNLRYILVNSLATYSSIKQALPDLMFKSKDWIQFHLQKKLLGSYLNYFLENDIKNKKFDFSHIFCNGIVKSDYAFTLLCYSTYLMTKSPTDKTIDQVHNLEKMMKIHSKFEEDRINEDDFLNLEQYNYDSKYFSNKETLFNFSSNLSYESGFILANKLQSLGLVSNIHEHWSDSINKSLCNIVNESGLRYKSTHFFSKKSSFIFTQALLEKLPNNFISSLKDFTEEEVYDKLKKFDNFDVTYKDVYSNLLNNKVPVFHVLDKEQRGLGREIYVMDLDTKILQQPLEDFFKKICKHVPNELISVPSNKRLNLIHHDVFEGDKMRNSWTFASLDCSKWAPQCNINKYLYFISGMSHIFPAGFLNYFYKFFERYYQKRVFINKRVYKAFHNNEKNKSISHFFKYDEDVDAYSFKMPYSFVMGIFNYLSSLMHAAGVMLAQSKMNIYLNEENNYINYHINVHSDDSGGLISATNEDTLELAIKGYELIQRRLNHNLSKKKCNFSNNYFEILSILYVNNKLLPLVNKFITNIQYEPTDTGPCTDMISCVSKSISLMSYGCTFSESYISKIIMSNMICDFYKIDQRSDLPLQAFGQPTSNPLLDLMVGGDSDIVRLLYVEGMAKDTDIYNHLKLLMLNEFDSEVVSIPSYKYKPRLKLNKSLKDQIIELDEFLKPLLEILPEDILKLIPNIGKKHIMSKLIEIHSNYKNINFISSMLYENNSRKMSRSLNYKNKTCMKTIFGYYSPKDLQKKHDYWHDLLKNRALFKEEADSKIADKLFNEKLVLLSEFMNSHKKTINYFKFLNDKLNPNFTMKKTNITNKPVYFYYNPEFHGIVLNTSPSNSYLYNNYPKYNFFATSSKVSKKAFELIVKKLKSDNIDAFLSYSRKYEKFQNKTYYIYSQVKSDLRTVDKNIDYYNFLMQSSFYHYELSRLIPNVNKLFYDFKINSKNDDDIDNLSAYKTYLELKPELQGEVEINEDFEELQEESEFMEGFIESYDEFEGIEGKIDVNDLNELNFWYSWKKPQKRFGTGWVGDFEIIIKLTNMIIKLNIKQKYLISCVCDVIVSGKFDEIDFKLCDLIMNYIGNPSFNNTTDESKYYFGYNYQNELGIYEKLSLLYGVPLSENNNIISHLNSTIVNKKTFSAKMRNNHRIYHMFNLLPYSESVNEVIDYDNKFSSENQNMQILSKIYKLGLKMKTINEADIMFNFDNTSLFDILSNILKKNRIRKISEFSNVSQNILKNDFIQEITKTSKLYDSVSQDYKDKLYQYIEKNNIDPYTIPEDIRDFYVKNLGNKLILNNLDTFFKDFFNLFENNFDEDLVRSFLLKWGDNVFKESMTLFSEKDMTRLTNFTYVTSKDLYNLQKNLLFDLLSASETLLNNVNLKKLNDYLEELIHIPNIKFKGYLHYLYIKTFKCDKDGKKSNSYHGRILYKILEFLLENHSEELESKLYNISNDKNFLDSLIISYEYKDKFFELFTSYNQTVDFTFDDENDLKKKLKSMFGVKSEVTIDSKFGLAFPHAKVIDYCAILDAELFEPSNNLYIEKSGRFFHITDEDIEPFEFYELKFAEDADDLIEQLGDMEYEEILSKNLKGSCVTFQSDISNIRDAYCRYKNVFLISDEYVDDAYNIKVFTSPLVDKRTCSTNLVYLFSHDIELNNLENHSMIKLNNSRIKRYNYHYSKKFGKIEKELLLHKEKITTKSLNDTKKLIMEKDILDVTDNEWAHISRNLDETNKDLLNQKFRSIGFDKKLTMIFLTNLSHKEIHFSTKKHIEKQFKTKRDGEGFNLFESLDLSSFNFKDLLKYSKMNIPEFIPSISFEELPKKLFGYNNPFSLIDKNGILFNELNSLIGNKIYDLNSFEIRLNSKEKSMLDNLISTISTYLKVGKYSEKELKNNDSLFYMFLNLINMMVIIDDSNYTDDNFIDLMINMLSEFNKTRNKFIDLSDEIDIDLTKTGKLSKTGKETIKEFFSK